MLAVRHAGAMMYLRAAVLGLSVLTPDKFFTLRDYYLRSRVSYKALRYKKLGSSAKQKKTSKILLYSVVLYSKSENHKYRTKYYRQLVVLVLQSVQ